jgi:hypothetical protein
MTTRSIHIVIALTLSCGDSFDERTSAVLTADGVPAHVFTSHATFVDTAPRAQLTSAVLHDPDEQLIFSNFVSCALREGESIAVDGVEFFGDIALAPEWRRRALSREELRWVIACSLARLTGTDTASPISMTGPRRSLSRTDSGFSVVEGAFFGDSSHFYVCDAGATSIDRVCTQQSDTTPGVSRCGLSFAGRCVDVCDERHGFFTNCRVGDGRRFEQVITTRLVQ